MGQTRDKKAHTADNATQIDKKLSDEKPQKIKKTRWGLALILITIGVILVLDSFNVASFTFNFWSLLKLWPLILVSVGLRLLGEYNHTIKIIATIGNIMLALFTGLVTTGLVQLHHSSHSETKTFIINQVAKEAKVDIKSAGKLVIGTHNTDNVIKYSGVNLTLEDQLNDQQAEIKIKPQPAIDLSDLTTDITLNKNLPLELDINFGAGSINADLRGINLTRLNINSGVSDITVKIDSAVHRNIYLDFELGISNATLYIPKTVGIRLTGKNNLSNVNIPELESRGDNLKQSANLDSFSTIYNINLNSGMTNFTLKYL